jgi:hypothetical protein
MSERRPLKVAAEAARRKAAQPSPNGTAKRPAAQPDGTDNGDPLHDTPVVRAEVARRERELAKERARQAAEAADEGSAVEPGDPGPPPSSPPLPLQYYADVQPALDAADFVEDLLIEGAMSVVYGESNCGKSFFALDLALHVAAGERWRGRDVRQGGVLYLALEGSHGIRNRVCAFKSAKGFDAPELPFAVVSVGLNLLNPAADTGRVIDTVTAAADRMRLPVLLIVVDTLSRALAGGNENAPEDMGALVGNADRIRQALSAHVQFIHHSGKDAARGARGHSLLRAATDTEIEVTRVPGAGTSTARVTKQRDLAVEGEFAFRLQPVTLGVNRRGKTVASCVVAEADAVAAGPKLSGDQQTALSILFEITAHDGRTGLPGLPADARAVPVAAWKDAVYRRTKPGAPTGTKCKAFNRAVDALIAAGRVDTLDDRVWIP